MKKYILSYCTNAVHWRICKMTNMVFQLICSCSLVYYGWVVTDVLVGEGRREWMEGKQN